MPTVAILTTSVSRAAGGVVDVVRRQSQSLQGLGGLSVTVLGLEDEYTAADLPAWFPVAPRVFPTRGPSAFGYSPGLARALGELKPHLAHTHGLWMYPSRACHRWARKIGRPYLVTPHGMLEPWALCRSAWKKRLAAWLYENAHLRDAACLHALSAHEADSFRRYGLKNPICVIPNGVDLPPDTTPAQPPPWDGLWESGCQVHLFLGRLNPKKGLLNLLAGWRDLRVRSPRLLAMHRLAVVGWDQGGHAAELESSIREARLDREVRLLGAAYGPAKDTAFRAASSFVLPSFSEGLPMAVLEAWSYGLPVVMTPECNLPEGFAAGAAIRVETNAASIATGLERLFAMSKSERREMGANGKRLVAERFNWPAVAAELKRVYDWVLGGGAPPACVRTD